MLPRWLLLSCSLLLLLFAASPALAQSDQGVISGTVTDRYGKALQGASIRAANKADGLVVESFTDKNGTYVMNQMSPGDYEVQASLGPQGIIKREVELKAGQKLKVEFVFDVREPRSIDPTYQPSPPSLIN